MIYFISYLIAKYSTAFLFEQTHTLSFLIPTQPCILCVCDFISSCTVNEQSLSTIPIIPEIKQNILYPPNIKPNRISTQLGDINWYFGGCMGFPVNSGSIVFKNYFLQCTTTWSHTHTHRIHGRYKYKERERDSVCVRKEKQYSTKRRDRIKNKINHQQRRDRQS